MKQFRYAALPIVLSLILLAGCGNGSPAQGAETQKPSGTSSAKSALTTKSNHETDEISEGIYLVIPKKSWDKVSWDNISSPHTAFLTIVKEIGEIPVAEDGSFRFEHAGLFYEDDEVTVTINKFLVNGSLDNPENLSGTADDTEVGKGNVTVELN